MVSISKKETPVRFDGFFTEKIRQKFKAKRQSLGLSYSNLSSFLCVNWSTLRKWEKGPTVKCGISLRPQVERFINGDFDEMLTRMQNDYYFNHSKQMLPSTVQACIERIANTYLLCQGYSDLKCRLISEISDYTNEILNKLVMPKNYGKLATMKLMNGRIQNEE